MGMRGEKGVSARAIFSDAKRRSLLKINSKEVSPSLKGFLMNTSIHI